MACRLQAASYLAHNSNSTIVSYDSGAHHTWLAISASNVKKFNSQRLVPFNLVPLATCVFAPGLIDYAH